MHQYFQVKIGDILIDGYNGSNWYELTKQSFEYFRSHSSYIANVRETHGQDSIWQFLLQYVQEFYVSVKRHNKQESSELTAEEAAVAEGIAVFVGSQCIGGGFLLGERDIILNAELLFIRLQIVGDMFFEECFMLMRDSEMEVDFVFAVACIEGSFHQMFECRCAGSFLIFMEEEESFGQFAVLHIIEQERDRFSTLGFGDAFFIHQLFELRIESEILQMGKEILDEGSFFAPVTILEEIFEHA